MTLCDRCVIASVCMDSVNSPDKCDRFSPIVVRCEKCRWFDPYRDDKYSKGQCLHAYGLCHNLSPTDFCSLGERKDNNAHN